MKWIASLWGKIRNSFCPRDLADIPPEEAEGILKILGFTTEQRLDIRWLRQWYLVTRGDSLFDDRLTREVALMRLGINIRDEDEE